MGSLKRNKMEQYFDIYEFRFYAKGTKFCFKVYAREEKTALEILDIENECNFFKFKRLWYRRYKVRCYSKKPPYEIEQKQLELAIQRKKKRYNLIALQGGAI